MITPKVFCGFIYPFIVISNLLALNDFNSGNHDQIEQLFDSFLSEDLTKEERLPFQKMQMKALHSSSRFSDLCGFAQVVFNEMGYKPFPRLVTKAHVFASFVKTKRRVERCRGKIADLPLLTDNSRIFGFMILESLCEAAYFLGKPVMALTVLRGVRWALKYGVCEESFFALGLYAVILVTMNDLKAAADVGEEVYQLAIRLKHECPAQLRDQLDGLVFPWTKPLAGRIKPLMGGHSVGMRSGHVLVRFCYILLFLCNFRIF